MRKTLRILLLIGVMAMVMAACSSESSTTTTTTRAAVGAEATTTTQTATAATTTTAGAVATTEATTTAQTATAATTTTAGAVATTEAQARTLTLSAGEELVIFSGFIPDSGLLGHGGFAVEGEDTTSPGPTIRVRKDETVTITFENGHFFENGEPFGIPHNFTIVADKGVRVDEMEPLWGAHVGGFDDPNLASGERGSVTFTAEASGSFYYVCAFSDHIGRGMWGRFIVDE